MLLVNAPTRPMRGARVFPIHLAALGSHLLAAGHDVHVIDLDLANRDWFSDVVRLSPFHVIGISVRNVPLPIEMRGFRFVQRLATRLRPHARCLVLGGAGFSLFPREILSAVPQVDVGVLGEGECALAALSECPERPRTVPGVCFLDSGELVSTPRADPLPGQSIPSLRPVPGLDFRAYSPAAVQSYRGCPLCCAHCTTPYLHGEGVRLRPLGAVLADLRFLCQLGARHVHVIDSEFNLPRPHADGLLEALIGEQLPLTFEAFLHPDASLDGRFLDRAIEAGVVRWHVDLVSASSRMLETLRPGVSPERVVQTLDLLAHRPTSAHYYLTYALPGETRTEEMDTVRLARRLREDDRGGQKVTIYPYFPYPNTTLEGRYRGSGFRGASGPAARILRYLSRPGTRLFIRTLLESGVEGMKRKGSPRELRENSPRLPRTRAN